MIWVLALLVAATSALLSRWAVSRLNRFRWWLAAALPLLLFATAGIISFHIFLRTATCEGADAGSDCGPLIFAASGMLAIDAAVSALVGSALGIWAGFRGAAQPRTNFGGDVS